MEIKQRILEQVEEKIYATPSQLSKSLKISEKKLQEPLDELLAAHELALSKQGKLALGSTMGYFKGILECKAAGFAFLRTEDEIGDIFINAKDKHGAFDGELVLVRLKKKQSGTGRPEGKVQEILSPLQMTVVGRVTGSKKLMFVESDDNNIEDIFIPKGKTNGAKKNQMVVVELTKRAAHNRRAEGRVIEILGSAGQPGMDILVYARRFGLVAEFPVDCEAAAAALLGKKLSKRGRQDFRKELVFTIDGVDAKDLDDAISLQKQKNGNLLLGVHIADVSHYVKEGSELDKEALRRGNSTYMVDRVVPMLPAALSNNLCSLHPHEDKYTLSCVMEFDKDGSLVSHEIVASIINSSYQMTYGDVNGMLAGDSKLRKKYAALKDVLDTMNDLAKKLRQRRFERGSIDFDLNEAVIKLDERGVPCEVAVAERGDGQKLIEEFMLMANVTVAQHFYKREIPFVYRVHEQPDAEKMHELGVFLGNFGIKLNGTTDIQPKNIQDVLNNVEGTPESNVVNSVTLRSLKKAHYDVAPVLHFGLAAEQYCHFTSPIRRYPDLMVHRIIKMYLAGRTSGKVKKRLDRELPEIAKQSSERERNSIEAERAVENLKMAEYMTKHIGEEFEGVVSGVTRFGIFVELKNMIEGMVPLSQMNEDYYAYFEKQYCVIGERTGIKITLGDKAKIKVVSVDVSAGKIEFAFVK